ncbi:MAG: PAS domain-containing protein [Acidobacteria bacterium]|nr:PAS domain-containing protein [Acidobacteriota bacterium]
MTFQSRPDVPQEILDSLAAQIAVIDDTGQVIAVNRRWNEFTEENQGQPQRTGVGTNYLASCRGADGEAVRLGIQRVLDGELPIFEKAYRCDSPTEHRWYVVQATPFSALHPRGAIIAHHNTTFHQAAVDPTQEAAGELRLYEEVARLSTLNRLPQTDLTAESFGLASIAEAAPEFFRAIVAAYEGLMERAVESRVFQHSDQHSDEARELAAQLGMVAAGPRDVVQVHCEALRRKTVEGSVVRSSGYQEEGRLLLLQLMGHLVSYYRNIRSVPHAVSGLNRGT